jgi:hypothetical protein
MLIEQGAGQLEIKGWDKEQEKKLVKQLMHALDRKKRKERQPPTSRKG